MSLLGAFGLFDLEQTRRFEPVALLCFVALFAWLALSVPFGPAWTLRVFLPAVGLLLFVLLYAYVFTLRVDGPLLPSILAQRDYAYFLLGPVVYMLHLRGWELRDFQQVFVAAASLTVVGLAGYDVAFAPSSLLLSGAFFALNLGEFTEQSQIFRLVNTSALFLALYFGRRLLQVRDVVALGPVLGGAMLSAALLAVSIPRGLLASTAAAVAVYAALLSRPRRAGLLVVVLPLCVLVFALLSPYLGSVFAGQFGQDRTYQIRVESAETAWRVFRDYPLLGFGREGAQTASLQDFFGENFYPSDIGLLGVAFQFGLVGLILYLSLAGWLCVGLLKAVWADKAGKADPKQSAFLWALLVVCLGFLIASPLQARLVYGTGLPVGAFAWGVIMARGRRGDPTAAPRPGPGGGAPPPRPPPRRGGAAARTREGPRVGGLAISRAGPAWALTWALMVVLAAVLGGGCLSRQAVTLDLSEADEVRLPQITGMNTNFFLAPEELGNDELWGAVEEADIPVMRFPGGPSNNSYDWRTGVVTPAEGPDGNAVPMEDFMARARSEGVSVDYVLNITESPESIRELARSWERTGAPVRRVEVGNEYYLPKLVGDIGGAEGYLERARTALEALRAGGYGGPVGLVAAPEGESSQGTAQGWNEEISRANTSGFDAVVLHHYPSLARDDFETVYEESPPELAASVGRLRERFPGKRVWVTEWNLGNPPDAPEFNTLGHALFDLRTLKALADTRVSFASYHALSGRGWELLGPDRFALDYENPETRLTRRVPYFAFQMVGEALSGGASYMSGSRPADGVEYMAFRTRDEIRVVAWSLEGDAREVKIEIDGPSPRFLGGEVLRGDLDDTNGSLLRMRRSSRTTWDEEVKPVLLDSPRIEGPGAVLLRYSL